MRSGTAAPLASVLASGRGPYLMGPSVCDGNDGLGGTEAGPTFGSCRSRISTAEPPPGPAASSCRSKSAGGGGNDDDDNGKAGTSSGVLGIRDSSGVVRPLEDGTLPCAERVLKPASGCSSIRIACV